MQSQIAIGILIVVFFLLLFLRVPVALSIGISTVLTSLYLGLPFAMVFQNMVTLLMKYMG